jgi:HEAT repeat protein
MGIVRNRDEQMSLRREAISRIRPAALSVEEIARLFDALAERELRSGLVNQLANRDDVAATDKLIEIARSGTDPELRRMAIQALARKNDPRSTKLLLEMVEKP